MNKYVEYNGVELILVCSVSGGYFPATAHTPEEFPEYTIKHIYVYDSNVDIINLFTEQQIEEIYELITH